MVLVADLVAPAAEAATRPDVHGLELGQHLGEGTLTLQRGGGVAVVEAAVVGGDNLVAGLQHLSVDETLDRLGEESLVVDRLHGGLGDLQHDGPVGTLLLLRARGLGAVRQLESGQLLASLGLVVGGVVGEDGGTVEGAVVLGEVQPALVADSLGTRATDTNTDDVGGGVEELLAEGNELLVAQLLREGIHGHGGHELLVADGGAIRHGDGLVAGVDLADLALVTEAGLLLGDSVGDGNPDATGTAAGGETESSVGTPVTGGLVEDDVGGHGLDVRGSDTLAQPGTLHLRRPVSIWLVPVILERSATYLGGGHSPDLVVVRSHEQVGQTSTHHADDPLVEVLGLHVGDASLKGGIDHAINALDLLLLGKHGDVVLEGVGDPFVLATDVGDTLVAVPVVILGEGLVDAVIEVLVVGEDNVTTDVVELSFRVSVPLTSTSL